MTRLAEVLGVDVYYLAMLRMLGCTVDALRGAEMLGDEVAVGGAQVALPNWPGTRDTLTVYRQVR